MNFKDITREAETLGVNVVLRQIDDRIAFETGGRIESWMFQLEHRLWGGYNGTEKTAGTKAKVANWCLDRAVNGPAA